MGGKIFGVGLNKTGTVSLTRAVTQLGFTAVHHNTATLSPTELTDRVHRAIAEGAPPFHYADEVGDADAFFDIRVVEERFEYFDRHCPGSKFILHTRDVDDWITSRIQHVEHNIARGKDSWVTIDVDLWREQWRQQHDRVLRYFAGRPGDLLVMDVAAGDGWEKLAPFLGCEVPSSPFPKANTARDRSRVGRVRRRATALVRRVIG
jgi:hypothetical protein